MARSGGSRPCVNSQVFALAVPQEEAIRIRDDVEFFPVVRSALAKRAEGEVRPEVELNYANRQIVSRAVASEEVIDNFAAGLEEPDISILSEESPREVRGMKQRRDPDDGCEHLAAAGPAVGVSRRHPAPAATRRPRWMRWTQRSSAELPVTITVTPADLG